MDRALAIFDHLIAFPTVSRDGNIDLIRYAAGLLAEAGIEARLYPGENGDRASLFATVGPQGPGGVVLSGHTDVVPVEGQAWSSDPFRLTERDGCFYGRGAADMKGFVACALDTLLSVDRAKLQRPLHLALSYDEEIGCVGVRPMLGELAKAGLKPDWIWVGEPTGMAIATGHKGKLAARATCCGHAAHSALAPTGLNAIHLAADFLGCMRVLQTELKTEGAHDSAYAVPYTTLHTGVIQGGTALNIVPDRCTLDFEIRNVAQDRCETILDRLFADAERISAKARRCFPETGIRIEVLNEYPGLDTRRDSPAVRSLSLLCDEAATTKVSFGTEGGLFHAALEVPVLVCGPGNMDQGHKPDEYVSAEQLQACRRSLTRLTEMLR